MHLEVAVSWNFPSSTHLCWHFQRRRKTVVGDEFVCLDVLCLALLLVLFLKLLVVALIVAVVVFVLLVRIQEDDELLTLPELGPAPQILNDGSPDPEGLPTVVDDEGQLWRKHPDGTLDWWDSAYNIWQRW